MTEFVVLLTAVLVFVLVFRQQPVVWVAAGIFATVFVPIVATRVWLIDVGPIGRIHPSLWIFLIGFVVTTVFSPLRRSGTKVRTGVVWLIGAWLVVTAVIVVLQSGSSIPGAFIVFYLTPPLAFFAIHAAATREDANLWKKVVPVVLAAAAAESVLALLQVLTHSSLLFERYYASNYWWRDYLDRAPGTLDSPLDLAAFLTMAIPLAGTLRRTPLVYALAALFAVGVVVSGSRTGVGVAAVLVVWLVFVRSTNVLAAVLTALAVGLAAIALLASPVAATLLGRFGEQGDSSTAARGDALGVGLDIVSRSPLGGNGAGYAYNFSTAFLQSSFENAYLATAIDFGIIVAGGMVLVQLLAVFGGGRPKLLFRLPGLVAILWGFIYSSFVSTGNFGPLSWIFIALAAIAGYGSRPVVDPPQIRSRPAAVVRPAASRTLVGKA